MGKMGKDLEAEKAFQNGMGMLGFGWGWVILPGVAYFHLGG